MVPSRPSENALSYNGLKPSLAYNAYDAIPVRYQAYFPSAGNAATEFKPVLSFPHITVGADAPTGTALTTFSDYRQQTFSAFHRWACLQACTLAWAGQLAFVGSLAWVKR